MAFVILYVRLLEFRSRLVTRYPEVDRITLAT
jgi:hypothetical protein